MDCNPRVSASNRIWLRSFRDWAFNLLWPTQNDVWLWAAGKGDGERYYEYVLMMYVDEILAISCDAKTILEDIQKTFKFKNDRIEAQATREDDKRGHVLDYHQPARLRQSNCEECQRGNQTDLATPTYFKYQVKVVIVKELTIKDDKRKVQNNKLRYSYVRLWICFRQYTSATSYAYFYCSTVYLISTPQ